MRDRPSLKLSVNLPDLSVNDQHTPEIMLMGENNRQAASQSANETSVVLSAESVSKTYHMGDVEVHAPKDATLALSRGELVDELISFPDYAALSHAQPGNRGAS